MQITIYYTTCATVEVYYIMVSQKKIILLVMKGVLMGYCQEQNWAGILYTERDGKEGGVKRKRASRREVEGKKVDEEGSREQEREKEKEEGWRILLAERNPNTDMETQMGMNI